MYRNQSFPVTSVSFCSTKKNALPVKIICQLKVSHGGTQQLILNKDGETMAFTSETLSHYSVGALSAMSDLMTEILDKMAPRSDTRAKFIEALGDLKVLIDAHFDFDLETMSVFFQNRPLPEVNYARHQG
jgi:hypothetical protein